MFLQRTASAVSPLLVLTRPERASRRFLSQVNAAIGQETPHIIAPVMEIKSIPAHVPNDIQVVVFSSENGVEQADRLGISRDLLAYCVGDRTAAAAAEVGFVAKSANGNADDLVDLILSEDLSGLCVHLHGRETKGDICNKLQAKGIRCASVTCYDQVALPLSAALVGASKGNRPLVIPVFSPRSAELISDVVRNLSAASTLVALSPAIAKVLSGVGGASVVIADHPNAQEMVRLCCQCLATD